jgi:antitoxin (DNA-binding transcriptional repressor) of toxin-antitoxin stability system
MYCTRRERAFAEMTTYGHHLTMRQVRIAELKARLSEYLRAVRGGELIVTESLRTLDRLRVRARPPDTEVSTRRAAILRLIASIELVEVDRIVLDRAAQPMPTDWARSTRFIVQLRCCGRT